MNTLVRADGEQAAISILADRLAAAVPAWADDDTTRRVPVGYQLPDGWASDKAAQPFVTVAQTGANIEPHCLRGDTPNPIETVSLQIDVWSSGTDPKDPTTGLVNPATGRPFTNTKAEAKHLAQIVASCIESSPCATTAGGTVVAASVDNVLWAPDPKSDRSRYVITARLTIHTCSRHPAVTLNKKASA